MFKKSFITVLAMAFSFAHAAINIASVESKLQYFDVYMTQNGEQVVLYVPIDSVFQGQTKFLKEGTGPLMSELISLIAQSKGQVQLDALITPNPANQPLDSSIAYTQAVELSSVLLQGGGEISYAPLTVKLQQRNDSYGFWKRYPNQSRFIMMSLSID